MPYEWTNRPPVNSEAELHLWPYRSLPKRGFVIFIGLTAAMIGLPLLAVLGSVILWALLPFLVAAIAGVWWGLMRSYRDGELTEVLIINRDEMRLMRNNPDGTTQDWSANPFWVQVRLHPKNLPVENYLTLKGGDREVEIGAFLTPQEREKLREDILEALRHFR